jgi:hypothetical protein
LDETAQLQGDLPAILSQALQVGAQQPSLLLIGTQQRLCYEWKGGQRISLFGDGQSHVRSRAFLRQQRAS